MVLLHEKCHAQTQQEVEKRLDTTPHGLKEDEAHRRLKIHGKNVLEEKKTSLWNVFLRQFNSPLIFILFIASFISLLLKEVTDFCVIISIVLINGCIGFWQERKAINTLEALKKLTETRNRVLRDGKMKIIPSSDLVPGDCLLFHQGELITSDVRLIESSSLMADESTITGESTPVEKTHTSLLSEEALPFEWTNMLLTGSTIVRGLGKGIVVRTGKETYLAKISQEAQEASPETPLNQALAVFSRRYVGILVTIFFIFGLIGTIQGRSILDLIYILLACLVSAVPEGLPIVITVVMVLGAIVLRKKQTLVRSLPSVETLGSTNIIATDKTGTVTEGKLIVQKIFSDTPELLQRIAVLSNEENEGTGDPLDIALIEWVENAEETRKKYPKLWEYPFDPALMLTASIHEIDGTKHLYVKGAYEKLREKAEGQPNLRQFDEAAHDFLKKGYRVLAFAQGQAAETNPSAWKLQIVGLIGFIDPPKKGVCQAVLSAKKAGIHVLMITGDHPITAQTVAQEVGIWKEHDTLLTGKEIEKMTDEELLSSLATTTVLARILPEHKYRVVKVLQATDKIIAVTGDGVNDIPALKAANIGIAMGDGTEAAKSVAQMVLVDNNFSVLVDSIKIARTIAANIRKVIYYLLSTSLQELTFLGLCITTGMMIPLTAIQILWINLVTDGIMDKTFPFIKEEGDVMKLQPKKATEAFLDSRQIKNILFFGLTQGFILFYLYQRILPIYPFATVSTILFTSTVLPQWANALQAQKECDPFFYHIKNSFLINPIAFFALPLGLILQCTILYIFPIPFKSVPLTLDQWIYPIISFVSAFLLIEARKWFQKLFCR